MGAGVHGHYLVPALKHADVELNKDLEHAQIPDQPTVEGNAQEHQHLVFHVTFTIVQ